MKSRIKNNQVSFIWILYSDLYWKFLLLVHELCIEYIPNWIFSRWLPISNANLAGFTYSTHIHIISPEVSIKFNCLYLIHILCLNTYVTQSFLLYVTIWKEKRQPDLSCSNCNKNSQLQLKLGVLVVGF